jgi:hypothetical protein
MGQDELARGLNYLRENNDIEIKIVDADPSKGFYYPYLLAIPCTGARNTLLVNCLNDYERPMEQGTIENQHAVEEVFSQFGEQRIRASKAKESSGESREESQEATKQRVSERVIRGLNFIHTMLYKGGVRQTNMPIMMPLIPGYTDDTLRHTASELSTDFAGDVDEQVLSMIEHAREIISDEKGIPMDEQVISYGHSKSAVFAKNFTMLHPDKVKLLFIGGVEEAPLPIDEIRLRVRDSVSENEQFEVIDGIVYKSITQEELDKIISEYNASRMVHQRDIQRAEDGSYRLPLNYPIGTADVDHYVDLSSFPGGKEGYRAALSKVPRKIFVGEREEEIEGHFSYTSGVTSEGIRYGYAEDLDYLTKDGRRASDLHEAEKASMHNRVLEYRAASLALFGRGANERLRNYVQLSQLLGMDMQSKVYTRVGHTNIYWYRPLADDTRWTFNTLLDNNVVPKFTDFSVAERIDPIYQLLRRARVGDKNGPNPIVDRLPKLPEGPEPSREDYESEAEYKEGIERYYIMLEYFKHAIDFYISKTRTVNADANMDQLYDSLTPEEVRMVLNDRVIQRIQERVMKDNHQHDAPEMEK